MSCEKWKNSEYPIYNIKYGISKNGLQWTQTGKVSIKLKNKERAVSTDCYKKNGLFHMWYSKKVGTYTLGYALQKWYKLEKKR